MIDQIFDLCVLLLVFLANFFGTTYKAVNVWIFVVIWPAFTVALIIVLVWQHLKIRQLFKPIEARKS
jgi:hypothetical protein